MRNILLSGIWGMFFGTTLIAQSDQDKIKPRIKIVKELSYEVENNKLKDRDSLFSSKVSNYIFFDKNEKLLESGKYNFEGEIYEKIIYKRNKNGFLEKGLRKGKLDELESEWTYEYDSTGNLVEIKTYNAQKKLTNTQLNKFDAKGNHTEMIRTNHPSNSIWRHIYEYNNKGQKIEEFRYQPNGDLKNRKTYHYNEQGNELEQIKFNKDGSYIKAVSEYDEMNNMISQGWYNDKNEKIYQVSFEYVYDIYGNWKTKKRRKDYILNMVWERKTEYQSNSQ